MPTDGTLSLQLAAISLMVKALAYEHPNKEAVLRTYDQLCGQLLASATYLKGDDNARQLIRVALEGLRTPLEDPPADLE